MTTFRDSPSGELVDATGGVESVFGRIGDVEAESSDYDTTLVENDSSVPGLSATDALESLAGSSGHDNPSSVPGGTLTEALDYLFINLRAPPAGSARDTFCGGSPGPFTDPNDAANIGDLAWNVGLQSPGAVATGWSVEKLPAEPGSLGAYRVTTPTNQDAGNNGPFIYLADFVHTLVNGPFIFANLGEIRFRARFDPSPVGVAVFTDIGLFGTTGSSVIRLYIECRVGSPNYRAISSVNPGQSDDFDTLVPIDDDFHDFIIRRVSATELRWFIDDALVVTNTDPDSIPPSNAVLTPIVAAFSSGSPVVPGSTFVDIDTWEFVPAS